MIDNILKCRFDQKKKLKQFENLDIVGNFVRYLFTSKHTRM